MTTANTSETDMTSGTPAGRASRRIRARKLVLRMLAADAILLLAAIIWPCTQGILIWVGFGIAAIIALLIQPPEIHRR